MSRCLSERLPKISRRTMGERRIPLILFIAGIWLMVSPPLAYLLPELALGHEVHVRETTPR